MLTIGLALGGFRRRGAEIASRQPGGVQRIVDRRFMRWLKYWKATGRPEAGKVARKKFSVRKHGEAKAKRLALWARSAGLRSIK